MIKVATALLFVSISLSVTAFAVTNSADKIEVRGVGGEGYPLYEAAYGAKKLTNAQKEFIFSTVKPKVAMHALYDASHACFLFNGRLDNADDTDTEVKKIVDSGQITCSYESMYCRVIVKYNCVRN